MTGNTDCPWCESDAHQEDMERLDSDFEKAMDKALETVAELNGAAVERGWQETGKCEACGAEWSAGEAVVGFTVFTKFGKEDMRV